MATLTVKAMEELNYAHRLRESGGNQQVQYSNACKLIIQIYALKVKKSDKTKAEKIVEIESVREKLPMNSALFTSGDFNAEIETLKPYFDEIINELELDKENIEELAKVA